MGKLKQNKPLQETDSASRLFITKFGNPASHQALNSLAMEAAAPAPICAQAGFHRIVHMMFANHVGPDTSGWLGFENGREVCRKWREGNRATY
jgi:hypothetical protein